MRHGAEMTTWLKFNDDALSITCCLYGKGASQSALSHRGSAMQSIGYFVDQTEDWHWNGNVILTKLSSLTALEALILVTSSATIDENFVRWHLTNFSSLATLEVVILTTSSAAFHENFVKMTFLFRYDALTKLICQNKLFDIMGCLAIRCSTNCISGRCTGYIIDPRREWIGECQNRRLSVALNLISWIYVLNIVQDCLDHWLNPSDPWAGTYHWKPNVAYCIENRELS